MRKVLKINPKGDVMDLGIELASDCVTEAFNIGEDLVKCDQTVSLEEFQQSSTEPVPLFLKLCMAHIEHHGANLPGIYRKSGNKAQVKGIIQNFQSSGSIDFSAPNVSMYTIGAAVKQYLAWMPALLTKGVTEDIMTIFKSSYNVPRQNTAAHSMIQEERYSVDTTFDNDSRIQNGNSLSNSMLNDENECSKTSGNENIRDIDPAKCEEAKESKIKRILCHLPPLNLSILSFILEHLSNVSSHSQINQMTAKNLALCFWPTLFPLYTVSANKNLSKDIELITDILEFLISRPTLLQYCEK